MREWNKPELKELDICNTEWDLTEGTVPDSEIVDVKTGQVMGPYMYSR
ncbi:MAG TPA: hypothetical protein VN258_15105 [Mobilitalea sp.]|nr:hypothetical protein [Mobilitalea sp.]